MAKRVTARRAKRTPPAKKRKPASDLLTRRQLAAAIGVHMQTVTKWEREGLPIAARGSKGRPSHYRELEVRAWLQVREEQANKPGAANPIQERARKERAQAALAEQALRIRNRDLLPRDEVEKAAAAEVAAVRTKLMFWSTTLIDPLLTAATLEGRSGIERVVDAGVRDVLTELAGRWTAEA